MNRHTLTIFMKLIRTALDHEKLSEEEKQMCTPEEIKRMADLALRHDLGHMLALALKRNELPLEPYLEKYILKASYRYALLNEDYKGICKKLEELEVPFIPLKGAVLRELYPQPWLRTSCDIDILVRPADIDRVASLLEKEYGCTLGEKGPHDIGMDTPKKIHVELHYNLVEQKEIQIGKAHEVLANVWESALMKERHQYWQVLSDEMFYFYHIAHMAKHFAIGGCGIRPFIDLWILNQAEDINVEKRNNLLQQGELHIFANAANKLCRVWFEGEEADELTRRMEEYILTGGIYGTDSSKFAVHVKIKGGRWRFLMYKVFVPYKELKAHYPILEKHAWLLPIMEVRRWFKLFFCGHMPRVRKALKHMVKMSDGELKGVKTILDEFGL